MRHPQTLAKTIGENACCAFVLMWCLGIEPDDDVEAIRIIRDMMEKGVIDGECTVKWQAAGKFLSGRDIFVDFLSISDISGIKERTPVCFRYGRNGHWVGVENGKVAFDPVEYSNCVSRGKPSEMRRIRFL